MDHMVYKKVKKSIDFCNKNDDRCSCIKVTGNITKYNPHELNFRSRSDLKLVTKIIQKTFHSRNVLSALDIC